MGVSLEQFFALVDGIRAGSIDVGSRTPVADVPAWATLEVITGGFATGVLLAGGPVLAHEQELARSLGVPTLSTSRRPLNLAFLSRDGLRQLRQLMATGTYRVDVPEEGALLVVAYLLGTGQVEKAMSTVLAIAPFFDRLRFYPVPDVVRGTSATTVCRQPLTKTIAGLEAITVPAQVARMNDSLTRLTACEDRVVGLFLDTVVDEGWVARATALSQELRVEQSRAPTDRRLHDLRRPLPRLISLLHRCVDEGADAVLTEQRGRLQWTLSLITNKRGAPGSATHTALRTAQATMAARPTHRALAQVVVQRVQPFVADGGLADVEGFTQPLTAEEAARIGGVVDTGVPRGLASRLERSLRAPVDVLVRRGVIPSAEVLASVVPQLTAQARAAGIKDPALRAVYSAVYQAFRRRRSLLLLNLQHQVRLEELPWIQAIEHERTTSSSTTRMSRGLYEQLAALTLTSFPQTLMPNPLLQEFIALAKGADIDAPFTEELAADIFMGTFAPKFITAAKVAATLLRGSIYERAYALPFDRVLDLGPDKKAMPAFSTLCSSLVATPVTADRFHGVAANGRVIEQQQLLTTHNLAVLVTTASLSSSTSLPWTALAQRCLEFMLALGRQAPRDERDALVKHKVGAFAWRQLVFFLSLADDDSVEAWRASVSPTMAKTATLLPYWRGLQRAIDGHVALVEERYLGWK